MSEEIKHYSIPLGPFAMTTGPLTVQRSAARGAFLVGDTSVIYFFLGFDIALVTRSPPRSGLGSETGE